MTFCEEILENFRARVSVVGAVGYDEERVLRELRNAIRSGNLPEGAGLYTWDVADGFGCLVEATQEKFNHKATATPDTVLKQIEDFKGAAVFVLKDFHMVWEAKRTAVRKLRNLVQSLATGSGWKNILLLTPLPKLPEELKELPQIEILKPDAGEMESVLERVAGASGALKNMRPGLREKIVETSLGLSENQAERVYRKAILTSPDGRLGEACIDRITREKRHIIRESGALELYPRTETLTNVGGLEILKAWIDQRQSAFGEEAKNYGLAPPGGLALIGIPGTGKSLCAKLTAGMWKMPLLKLDMGAAFGGVLGSTEKNVREAIQISEVISPCVLWVDEFEKAFAASGGDGGTASRVRSTFLTWMQEKEKPVVVVATANDVSAIPPEYLRKGRFDETFFLDLPTRTERKSILQVHLKKCGYEMAGHRFDLDKLAGETQGFVGAELEAAVKDAMFPAFQDGGREMETGDVLKSVGQMVPMARSHKQAIEDLRKWVHEGLARNASAPDPEGGDRGEIDVDSLPAGRRMLDV